MNNSSPNQEIIFNFHPGTPISDSMDAFPRYLVTYKGTLPHFYERLLTSNLMDYIVDFTVDPASHQAYINLANPKPLGFWYTYAFIKQSEVWRPSISVKLMSVENSYRYFHGKCIRNDPEWVRERMELFEGRTGWNLQDLLYYEDEHFEEIWKNLKAEERKVHEDVKSRDSITVGKDDFTTKDTDDGSDMGVSTEKQDIARRFPRKDDEEKETDIDDLEVRDSRKRVKVGMESKGTEKVMESFKHRELIPVEEKGDNSSMWKEHEKRNNENKDDDDDEFPDVFITINKCNFELEDKMTEECTCKISRLEGVSPIKVGGDIKKLSMYGYMDSMPSKEPYRR